MTDPSTATPSSDAASPSDHPFKVVKVKPTHDARQHRERTVFGFPLPTAWYTRRADILGPEDFPEFPVERFQSRTFKLMLAQVQLSDAYEALVADIRTNPWMSAALCKCRVNRRLDECVVFAISKRGIELPEHFVAQVKEKLKEFEVYTEPAWFCVSDSRKLAL